MFTSKLVIAASLVLATTGAFADSGDLHINDWANINTTVVPEQAKQEMASLGEGGYVFAVDTSSSRSRAEVLAELRAAQRFGLVSIGEGNVPIATAEQEQLIAKAGHDAAEQFAKSSDDVEG
jgi:hypothetical protein